MGLRRVFYITGFLLFGMINHGFAMPPGSLTFNNGSAQNLNACIGSTTIINTYLTCTDGTSGLTLTWTVTTSPAHGIISGLPQTGTSGTSVAPSSVSYAATAGYIGTDAFTVQVSDGVATASTTINVVVNPVPVITSVSPNSGNPLAGVTITGSNFNTTSGNNIVYFGTTRASVTSSSATSLSVTVPNGAIFSPVTVENNTCSITGAYKNPFLPTFSNAAFAPGTVNFASHVDITTTSAANHLTYGDIDGDGKVDVIESNFGTSTVYVYRNTSTTGSPSFSLAATLPLAAAGADGATIGDIDGDGLLDIVVAAAAGGGNIYIYRNTSTPGSISFASAVTVSYITNANISAIADIDGDGMLDIICSELTNLAVYRNTSTVGSISFAARVNFTAPANINGVATGDLDGDGKTDVMVANSTTSVSAWRNISTPGTISFGVRQDFTTPGTSATGVGMADIDGDGIMDIVCTGTSPNDLSVFKGTSSSGTISMGARADFGTGANDQYFTIGDFDGDGKPDVAVSSITSGSVGVYRNTSVSGTVSFSLPVAGPLPPSFTANSGASQLGAVDIDGDGLTDIVVTDQSTTKFSVLLNSPITPNTGTATVCPGLTTTLSNSFAGGGTWTSSNTAIATVVSGTGVVTGVLSGTCNITYTTNGTLQTVVTAVTVTATPTVSAITSPSPAIGFVGSSVTLSGTNFNTTTTNDIVWFGATRATVTSASATSLTVTVPYGATFGPITVENSACGLFATSRTPFLQDYNNAGFIANTVNFDPRFDFAAGTSPVNVSIADFDGDGKPDVVFCNQLGPNLTIFPNISSPGSLGAGSFGTAITKGPNNTLAMNIAVADMDGDGKLDIITSTTLGAPNYIRVFRNTSTLGAISFAAAVTVTSNGNSYNGLTIADIDGDGKPEVISTTSTVVVFQNNSVPGTLSFGSGSSFATGTTPMAVTAADIDGDGKKDIIASDYSLASAAVLINTSTPGSISFAAFADFAVGSSNIDVTTADIDGDGKLDVITANSTSNTITVLRNTSTLSTPSFAAAVNFPTGGFPTRLAIGDADGDGKPDIYVTNQSSNTFSLLRNTASSGSITAGSLAAKVDFATALSDFGIAVGDLDGDGKADVVTASTLAPSGSTVSVFRNEPLQPIGGTFVVCQNGPTTTLTEAAPGGAWTSSNTAIATIGSSTGVLAGLAGGSATVTYQGTATTLTAGNYTVQSITVNPQSSAAFTSGTNPTCQGGAFTSTFNNASAGITAYAWNFGDGATAAGNNPVHAYTTSGNFTVSLQVTNTNGCTSTSTLIQTVNPTPPAISGTLVVCTGSTTTLTNSLSGSWSSASPGVATVGAATGIVTGVTPGTSVITFTSSAGCIITATVTVNQTPAAISVPGQVCVGNSITLSDTYLPGTGQWSSNNTALATINAVSGLLTGAGAGSPVITYTIPATGCFSTASVVVNPLPASIAGTLSVCIGLTTPLTDATPGGNWSSISGAVASVNSSGIVSGLTAGNSIISYTLPATGCASTAQVTVNSNPSITGGTTTVCTGFTTTLTGSGGGTWSSSDPSIASVGAGSGVVTGVAAGTATITYSIAATGCYATVSYVVNQTPAAITGTTTVCVGSSTVLTDVTPGGTWTSSIPADVTISGSATITGLIAGTPNILYTIPASGCFVSTPFVVNGLPNAISGGSAVCTGGTITLTSSAGGTWTSSNPTFATIGATTATTAVINGLAAGSLSITYTLGTGCAVSEAFVVNQTPAAVTGASTVCNGLSTAYADATTGGVWSSSNGAVAGVSGSGVVTGNSTGTANIIYTLGGVCSTQQSITVLAQPAVVSGAGSVCTGAATTLSDATPGGTWTSNTPSMATIGATTATTAVINGISAGTLAITYTLADGCFSAWPFVVNPTPAAITGANVVCVGSTIVLSDVTSGGSWSSSDNSKATVNAVSGVVTGVAAGAPNIIYTMPGLCFATYPITVNGQPNISSFASAATSQCANVAGTGTVTSASLGAGTFTVTYNLSGANSATASTATLTMGGGGSGTFSIPGASLANAGSTTVTITQITNNLGCTIALSTGNTSTFNVYPYPTAYTVTGTGSYCAGGAGLHVILSNSAGGISYQLYLNGVATGAPVNGTFAALDMGAQTAGGTYTVIGTNTSSLCATTMTGSAVITVNPLPTAYGMTGGGAYCAGGTGVAVGMANSDIGVNYQLYAGGSASGSPVAGTGAAISFGLQTTGGTYTVIATNATTACSNTMTGSEFVTVNSLPAAITGTASVCPGMTTTLTSATAGGTWTSVNTAAATVNASSGVVSGVAAGTSVISYTLPTGCTTTIIVTVNPNPSAVIGAGTVCTGSTMPLTDASGSGTWTTSNAGEAIIGASSGVVTGVAAGTPTMTYTLPTGCYATAQITVSATPAAITGTLTTCPGMNTLLSSTTAGGTWTSSNVTYATAAPASGVVTGVSAGSAVITYTASGCYVTATVVINPTPAAITGTTSVCAGSSVTLADANPGGSWTSSNPAFATTAGSVITGVSAGVATITYTLPTGCYITTSFTVNPVPGAITGTTNVCVGLVTNLGNAIVGGTWTSSNTALATVAPSTGVVTGVLAGTPVITYTLPGGCFTTAAVVVNSNPSAIVGNNNVCQGLTTALTDPTTGGTWSSSNTAIAGVTGGGVVSGVSAGNATISYTLGTGCYSTLPFTVNALPGAITGAPSVCAGSSTLLASTTAGGTWTSSNTFWATVNAATGSVTGVAAGTPNITYTLPTGCIAVTPIVVNPTPVAITGSATVCTGLTTTLSDATSGGSWSSSNLTLATVGSGSGIVTGISNGSVVMTYTLPAGCTAVWPMTVNTQPGAIAGVSTVCTGFTAALTDGTSGGAWSSSNTAVATVNAVTGVVSGLTTGTLNITYTMPGGCYAIKPMTVNPTPAPIAGVSNVCVGSSVTMTDASIGGTWSSSNAGIASAGSLTGVVTGLTAGTINITYTLPAGCIVTWPVTVNPLPAAITGVPTVCVLATSTIADATPGGIWTSSNISQATIGATTGIITGVAAGNPTFTYILPTSCYVTVSGVVNALPAIYSVTGGGNYCAGGTGVTVGLSNTSTGVSYQLYYNNGVTNTTTGSAIPGTGSAISFGLVTGGGTYTVLAINNTTGCSVLMSGSATVVVNSLPTAFTVSQTITSYCAGGGGITISLSGSTVGVNYQLYYGGVLSGTPVAGAGGSIPFGPLYAAGTYSVTATNASTGCTQAMTGVATVSINPLPTAYSITGGGSYCALGSGVAIGLSNSDIATNYTLNVSGTPVSTLPGIPGALNFGLQTTLGSYTITASNTITGCSNTMAGTVTVSTNPLPSLQTVSGGGSYCAGGTGVAVSLLGSQFGYSYQLYYLGLPSGSPVIGTGSGISFGLRTGAGAAAYTVVATNPATGCTNTMTGSASITINPLPAVHIVTGGGPMCFGGAGVHIGLDSGVTGTTYQLYNGLVTSGGAIGGTTGSAVDFGVLTTNGVYTVKATTGGCTTNMYGSATVVVNALPVQYAVTGTSSYCAGGAGVHVGLSNSDLGINYQVFSAGIPVTGLVPGVAGPLDFGAFTTSGSYTVVATNAATGCTSNMTGSAVISINPLPAVRNVTGGGSYCPGGTGVHIGLNGSSVGVSYQLYISGSVSGAALAGTSSALDFNLRTAPGTYTVLATNVATGCTNSMAGSATVVISATPAVNIVTGGGAYCAGTGGVHIGLDGSVAGNNYQLFNGTTASGAVVAGSGGPLDFGLRTLAGTYTVTATSTATGCTSGMTGSAVVITNSLPTAFNMTGGGSYCAGGAGIHAGLSGSVSGVSYQLFRAASSVGVAIPGTGSSIDFGLLTVAGTYTVTATDGTSGCTNAMNGSSVVNVNAVPGLFTVYGGGSYCAGGAGDSIFLSGSNTGISYQLMNGTTPLNIVAGTGAVINFGAQTLAGNYSITGTNTTSGCAAVMTGSANISINSLPVAYAVTGGGAYCATGNGVHVGLLASDAGTTYQLYNGTLAVGAPVNGTGAALDFGLETLPGTYSVTGTNGSSCINNMGGTVTVTTNPLPPYHAVTGGGSYCAGGTGVYIGLNGSNSGINYQLYKGATAVGTPVPGTGLVVDFGVQSAAGNYWVMAITSATACTDTMTGSATVSVNSLPALYNVMGGGSYCAGGSGLDVSLSGSSAGINYQLYRGTAAVGGPVAGTGIALDFGIQSAGGIYTVTATDALSGCTNSMTGSANILVNPVPASYGVTGGGSYCSSVASTLHIGLGGSQAGVSYQLYNGSTATGIPVAGTGSTIDFGVEALAGTYTVVGTNSGTGCMHTMPGSAAIQINPAPLAYLVSGGGGYCTGGTGVHVFLDGSDTSISYQLYNGTSSVGSAIIGAGIGLDFGLQTGAGSYSVIGTNGATGCTTNMTGIAVVTINPLPSSYSVTGGGAYCVGAAGMHIMMGATESGVQYQLYRGSTAVGAPIAGTGLPVDLGLESMIGTYTAVATNTTTGCMKNMSGSAIISVNPLPDVFTVTGGGNYCAGGSGLAVGLSGSVTGINYKLFRSGLAVTGDVPGTGSALNFGLQTAPGVYTVSASNPSTGCMVNMVTSVSVGISTLPVVYSVAGGGSFCSGSAGPDVYLTHSDTGISYQLMRGTLDAGSALMGNNNVLHFGGQVVSGSYTVVATNLATGCVQNMTGMATVTANAVPAVYVMTGGGSYCTGATGVHIGLSNSGTGINYQLIGGGTVAGAASGTGLALDFGLFTGSGSYYAVATNVTTGCTDTMSGIAHVAVNLLPGVFSMTGGGNYCAGGTGIALGLLGSSTGASYQLYTTSPMTATGAPVHGNGAGITFGLQTEGGTYTVIATDTATGCVNTMSGSSVINVVPTVIPAVSIAASLGDTVCSGISVTYTANSVNGGSVPGYQWQVNGVAAASGASYTYLPVNGDVVSVRMTSSAACPAPDTATDHMNMTVRANLTPVVSISALPGDTVCAGTIVHYTASTVNGGTSPSYTWSLNSAPVGSGNTFSYAPADNDIVFCTVTSNYPCLLSNTAISNYELMKVQPGAVPTVTVTAVYGVSSGAVVYNSTFTAAVTNGGYAPSYQWMVKGITIPGATNATYTASQLNNGDEVACYVVVNSICGMQSASGSVNVVSADVAVHPVATSGNDIRLVPNPNNGQFTIVGNTGNLTQQEYTLEITDMIGQSMFTSRIHVQNGAINEHVVLDRNIANGMYLLTLKSGSESRVFHMVVEQ